MSTFVHATPAPTVEPAIAEKATIEEPAIAASAQPTEAAVADKAEYVDPARTYDNPLTLAPENVRNPKIQKQSGLSVEALRNNILVNEASKIGCKPKFFESYAAVIQNHTSKNDNALLRCLPCIFGERAFVAFGEVRRYIFVTQQRNCFVYIDKNDPAPLYGLDLNEFNLIREDFNHPDPDSITISPVPNTNKPRKEMVTFLFKHKTNKKEIYQFTFDTVNDNQLAERFLDMFSDDKKFDDKKISGGKVVSVTGTPTTKKL